MEKENIKINDTVYIKDDYSDDIIEATIVDGEIIKKRYKDGKYRCCLIQLDYYVDKDGNYSHGLPISKMNKFYKIDELYATPIEVFNAIEDMRKIEYIRIASEIQNLKDLLEFPMKYGNCFSYEHGPDAPIILQVYKDKAKELTGIILTDDCLNKGE